MDNALIKLILHKNRFNILEIKVEKMVIMEIIRIMQLKGGEIIKVKALGGNRMLAHPTDNLPTNNNNSL